jgi:NAD-dependent dihydropyrimidine dehydrogenase PreA subunit
MKRKIIKIDEEKCTGCGLCAEACHEGAIGMVGGKAKLLREDYCDGLGDCLPACPVGAISFEEREAPAYTAPAEKAEPVCSCPGSKPRSFRREEPKAEVRPVESASRLTTWPVQIKLAPVKAQYFDGANLLVAADCSAYAYGNFHEHFIKNRVVLIGCPKLDYVDYGEKLTEILKNNNIKSVTVVRMEVPCCGGIENAVKTALSRSGKLIPWQVVTISTDGRKV